MTTSRIRRRASTAGLMCAAAALVIAAAGCGDDAQTVAGEPPLPRFEEDGAVPVEDFNDYLETIDEAWESDAKRVTITFAQPVVQEGGRVGATLGPGDDGTTVAIVTVDGLGDDSAAARRTAVVLEPDGDLWRLVRAQWTHRCHLDRGHQDWSTEPCV